MGYLKEYILLIVVVLLIFHFTGLLAESGSVTSLIFNLALDPSSFKESTFVAKINIIIALLAAVGIVVGIFTKSDTAIWASMFGVFILLGQDLIAVYNVLKGANAIFAVLCISPLLVIYVLACVEWVRGM